METVHPVSGAHHADHERGGGFRTFNFLVGAGLQLLDAGAVRKVRGGAAPVPASAGGWDTPVITCSALHDTGVAETWQLVLEHDALKRGNGWFDRRRSAQALEWMKDALLDGAERTRAASRRALRPRLPGLAQWTAHETGHLDLLSRREVYGHLRAWLAD